MTMSGTNPVSQTKVPFGIGWEKSEKLWYRSNTKYFLASTNFAQAAVASMQAAKDIGLTENEQNIVDRVARTHAQIANLIGSDKDQAAAFYDEDLTDAETRVAESVARGLSNKEIAAELDISVRTVENHISHILDKKRFSNRVEIARLVIAKTLSYQQE